MGIRVKKGALYMTENKNDDNIIAFTPRPKSAGKDASPPPMLNIPAATKYLAGLMILSYLGTTALEFAGYNDLQTAIIFGGGFTPASWTGAAPFHWYTIFTPLTATFLHGSLMHLGVNLMMLVAIGSGVEKWAGKKPFLMIFLLSSIIAMATHLAIYPYGTDPVIGASGGVSGLFGAILFLNNQGRSSFLPVALLWIAISVAMGMAGAPDGSPVAWVAHIGGFLGGIGIAQIMLHLGKRS